MYYEELLGKRPLPFSYRCAARSSIGLLAICGIQGPTVMFAEKSWGSYRVLGVSYKSTTVKVTLNPGHGMNYHSHEIRDEVWTVESVPDVLSLKGLFEWLVLGM